MDQSQVIMNLRHSLQRSHAILASLGLSHPEALAAAVESLPPQQLLEEPFQPPIKMVQGEGSVVPSAADPSSLPGASGADSDSDSTFSPKLTEAQAGEMFASTRNMERDAFFKARIAHGIDDDKVIDLGPKVDCKKAVEGAVGAVGLVNVMEQYPEEEVRVLTCASLRSSYHTTPPNDLY